VILSASRRTDIPARHLGRLLEGLRRGWLETPNPFNPKQVSRISLRSEDIDAVFFWTRDARAMLPHLDAPLLAGLRSVFLYTITGYGPPLEPHVPAPDAAAATLRALAARVGAERVQWRYDPLVLGSGPISATAHRKRFRYLAAALEGSTRRVVISLVDWYRKTTRSMRPHLEGATTPLVRAASPDDPEVVELVSDLREIAAAHGISAAGCCEPEWHERGVLPGGACIDSALLETLWGLPSNSRKDPGQRPACRCAPSRDIGRYGSCDGGCRYCYAALAPRGDSK